MNYPNKFCPKLFSILLYTIQPVTVLCHVVLDGRDLHPVQICPISGWDNMGSVVSLGKKTHGGMQNFKLFG